MATNLITNKVSQARPKKTLLNLNIIDHANLLIKNIKRAHFLKILNNSKLRINRIFKYFNLNQMNSMLIPLIRGKNKIGLIFKIFIAIGSNKLLKFIKVKYTCARKTSHF